MSQKTPDFQPGLILLDVLTGAFRASGTTLEGWSRANGLSPMNVRSAALCGIEPTHMSMLAFALAGATGAIAGALIAPIGASFYENGLNFALKGFAAAVLGGFGNPVGAVVGGILLGIGESLCAGYLSSAYKDAVSLLVLLSFLILRPSGLLGRAEARRV